MPLHAIQSAVMVNTNPDNRGSRMTQALTWEQGDELLRAVGSERWLAKRIRDERSAREWSQAELSRKLTEVGHSMHQSAISKIEAPFGGGRDRRAITIDEALGFSKVFKIPLGELLLPPDAVRDVEIWKVFVATAELRNDLRTLGDQYDYNVEALRINLAVSPKTCERLRSYRAEIMEGVEAQLREMEDDENERRSVRGEAARPWDPRAPELNRPPVVLVIDELLADDEVTTND